MIILSRVFILSLCAAASLQLCCGANWPDGMPSFIEVKGLPYLRRTGLIRGFRHIPLSENGVYQRVDTVSTRELGAPVKYRRICTGDYADVKPPQEFRPGDRVVVYNPSELKWLPAKYHGKSDKNGFDYTIIYDDTPNKITPKEKERVCRLGSLWLEGSHDIENCKFYKETQNKEKSTKPCFEPIFRTWIIGEGNDWRVEDRTHVGDYRPLWEFTGEDILHSGAWVCTKYTCGPRKWDPQYVKKRANPLIQDRASQRHSEKSIPEAQRCTRSPCSCKQNPGFPDTPRRCGYCSGRVWGCLTYRCRLS